MESIDINTVQNYCNKLIHECIELEKPIRDLLNDICRKTINDIFVIPEETIILHCHLTDKVDIKHSIRVLPEESSNNVYTFDDVEDIEMTNSDILKRRFINSLIQGAAYTLTKNTNLYLDEIYKIESKLPDLYNKIRILSDYILFNREEKIDEKNYSPSAYVAVTLGNEGKKTIIDSQGIIFPYLLQETIRGFFELFASHGLPENNKKAMYIIRHSDFILAEEWDMRFGVSLYNNIFND